MLTVTPTLALAQAGRTVGAVVQKEKRRERIRAGADTLPENELADVFTD